MAAALPIYEILDAVKSSLAQQNTLIIQAPPGAGKSTVLPFELLNEPWLFGKKILLLEPRRLAARAVAARMAELKNEEVGETIGYRVRFENRIGRSTRIEVVTEGILTRMLQNDNALENVGMILFDEFHERSLHADLALALCREAQQVLREDLRIVIMSATLDGDALAALLNNAPVITSTGRQYPVAVRYFPPDTQLHLAEQTAQAVKKALQDETGDVLVFLPGAGEIKRTQELLEQTISAVMIYPLYGDLPHSEQQRALMPDPNGLRKVVLATSIAETSLTIEGIGVVVDSGYARVPRFDPRSGLTRLETVRLSKDAADQRAGRAGRLGPGVCYRLWSEAEQRHLRSHRTPEILEADLAPAMLELCNWGVTGIEQMAWLTPPPSGNRQQALALLQLLGAVNTDGSITTHGRALLQLPTHPRIAHLLLEGKKINAAALAADVAAVLEERDPLPKTEGTSLALRVDVLRRWRDKNRVQADTQTLQRVARLATSWRKHLGCNEDNALFADELAGHLVAAAYPERIAKKQDSGRYKLANGRQAKMADMDPLSDRIWLAIAQLDAGTSEGKIFLAAPLSADDIISTATEKETITWDYQKGELLARKEKRIGEIVAATAPLKNIPETLYEQLITEVVQREGLRLFDISDDTQQWLLRITSLHAWRSNENWPDVSELQLLATAGEWLVPFLKNIRRRDDFRKTKLQELLPGLLDWNQQQQLEKLAPATINVPSGSAIRLQYQADASAPVLAVRLQELFGLTQTPTVNEGRQQVMLHLLSPAMRPMQVTQDLHSFWQNTYPEIRKELRIRYPKHSWPVDPWTAQAIRGVKKRGT
jgi:ATP-dependent helicase HrpB